jgi:predicted RNA methylase
MYARQSQLTGRERLHGLRVISQETAAAMELERSRFARLAGEEAAPRVVSAFNLFQTPEPLARRLAAILNEPGRVLEPSAGLGRLVFAVRARSQAARITMIDNSPECCGELYRLTLNGVGSELVQGDFLTMTPDRLGLFDSVIMNPPFKQWRDIKHIEHARTFLAPGGRLAAICANGPRQREKLMPEASQWIDLPANSFAEAGTKVNAAIVVFDG